MKKRLATVIGVRLNSPDAVRFDGKIELDLRHDSVYYVWKLHHPDGEFLGSKCQPVSFRIIPEDEDRFEFALKHVIESINRTRYSWKKVFKVENCFWEK
jgi:hypothetical protein